MNLLKEKVKKKELLKGTHVSLGDPAICAILGRLNFDFIWVDMEHTYIDCRQLYIHLNAARSVGASVIVRIPQNDFITLKRVMEMGVDGIIFPMIRSVEDARKIISATFYPPAGNRGFGPRDAIGFGLSDVREYIREGSLEMCRFIQIEHIDAVNCLDELAEVEGIDGFIFGPNDLSGSVGQLGYPYGEVTESLLKKSIDILEKHNKYFGVSTGDFNEDAIQFFHRLGIRMISAGADTDYLLYGAQCAYKNLSHTLGKGEGNGSF